MAVRWSVTIDCAAPAVVAGFWATALGYESREPLDTDDDGAFLHDPDGALPSLSFLRVPEGKVGKNRLHLDIQAGGGRAVPWEERWPRAVAAAERLVRAGATVVTVCEWEGRPDHYLMADPEGNEFCVL
ncbi:VOC family protein [Actinophytocola glycyrrhizae]|uniref:VOC family protein n=1 Tax=Actinophytocola glycyrrhizae TaxID=2044873 RepID=A0ABV9S1J5_9PSEU